VVHGSILDQRVEAITNAANERLEHHAALAGVIAQAAGAQQLARESRAVLCRVSLQPGGAVSTSSLSLQSRGIQHIVHAVAPHFLRGNASRDLFQRSVKAALTEAESLSSKSLAIPLIGSGVFGWPIDDAAQLLSKALVAWLSDHPATSLRDICLIDVDRTKAEAMLAGLRSVAQHGLASSDRTPTCNSTDVKHPQWQWSWFLHEQDKWVDYDEEQNVQLERAWHQCAANTGVASHCRIMGDKGGVFSDSKHKPEDAPGAVYDVFFGKMHQQNVVSGFTRPVQRCQPPSPLPDVAVAVTKPITISSSSSSSNSHCGGAAAVAELALNSSSGVSSSSSSSSSYVLKLYAVDRASVAAAARKVRDELQANWAVSAEVEVARRGGHSVSFSELVAAGLLELVERYHVELIKPELIKPSSLHNFKLRGLGPAWLETVRLEVEAEVRRLQDRIIEQRFAPPSTWTTDADDSPTFVDVVDGSAEWQHVVQMFNRGTFASRVKRVRRVEHHALWYRFARARDQVANENAGDANEQLLIHGTNKTDPVVVALHDAGIDHNYSDWGLFGRGSYFAEEADYSHKGFAFKQADGQFSMFLVRVVCGCVDEHKAFDDITKQLRHPPPGHHSVRGPVRLTPSGGQFAYVLYRSYHAYPEYLVTYDK
jgi:O-acetyl-ADP-ribose deacetylase (regulator of RNase III)